MDIFKLFIAQFIEAASFIKIVEIGEYFYCNNFDAIMKAIEGGIFKITRNF